MTNVVIASAARTAVGSFGGSFANTPAHDLGAAVLKEIAARAGVDASEVSETILGQVLTAGQGQNPARQAHINAGFAKEAAAWSINQVCGSGLRAVAGGSSINMPKYSSPTLSVKTAADGWASSTGCQPPSNRGIRSSRR